MTLPKDPFDEMTGLNNTRNLEQNYAHTDLQSLDKTLVIVTLGIAN